MTLKQVQVNTKDDPENPNCHIKFRLVQLRGS